jgi:hypothetical protein
MCTAGDLCHSKKNGFIKTILLTADGNHRKILFFFWRLIAQLASKSTALPYLKSEKSMNIS